MEKQLVITIDFPTSLAEVNDRIIAGAVEIFGTQYEAAKQLGTRPETICRRLNHRRRKQEEQSRVQS